MRDCGDTSEPTSPVFSFTVGIPALPRVLSEPTDRSIVSRFAAVLVVALLATACEEESTSQGSSGGGRCNNPGPAACYCAGGEPSGIQQCLEDGTLTRCTCTRAVTMPVADSSAPVCAELAGTSGCEVNSFESEELPASLLFVVDRSGSMSCNPPPLQDTDDCNERAKPTDESAPSRWSVTVDALIGAFQQLNGTSASIGLSFFSTDQTCGVISQPVVPVSPVSGSVVADLEASLRATTPAGGTPIVGAVTLAYQHMHEEAGAGIECPGDDCPCANPPCGANGNRYVVLITDGEESCAAGDDEQRMWLDGLLDDEAKQAVLANVRTFVIGAPGSEPARGFLSELAFQGGTARNNGQCSHDRLSTEGDCHFDMTTTTDFAADFATVLADISGAALGCEFAVPTLVTPETENTVNVQITAGGNGAAPVCLARDDTATCDGGAEGWQFTKNPDGSINRSKIALCGSACGQVAADAGARVDVLVGCQTIVLE